MALCDACGSHCYVLIIPMECVFHRVKLMVRDLVLRKKGACMSMQWETWVLDMQQIVCGIACCFLHCCHKTMRLGCSYVCKHNCFCGMQQTVIAV